MGNKIEDQINNNSRGFHKNSDGSWGTDPHDGDNIAKIIASIGKMIADIIIAKKR